jgi:hypothetical protein
MQKLTFEERFWAKVEKTDGCWLWRAKTNGKYGQFYVTGIGHCGAHRVSWGIAFGVIPAELHVCHRCDTPLCVRPDHLFLGTRRDNMRDCVAKNRFNKPKGEANWRAHVTEAIVVEIRSRFYRGDYIEDIAAWCGLGHTATQAIAMGQKWRHVPMPGGIPYRPTRWGLMPKPIRLKSIPVGTPPKSADQTGQ